LFKKNCLEKIDLEKFRNKKIFVKEKLIDNVICLIILKYPLNVF